nr:RNA-directed DNA polymerase [Tanacetum cinerariifolium]
MTEITKLKQFAWKPQARSAFDKLKQLLSSTSVLALPCFDEVFEVEYDASGAGIGAVMSQLGRPVAYFSEKLNDGKKKYTTYDKEFYAIIRALDHWQPYLISKEFILHSDHEALKYIQGQHKLQPRHAKWVEFLQAFNFNIKHKPGKLNKGADALSRKYSLLNSLEPRVIGFELLKGEYFTDPNYGDVFLKCQKHAFGDYKVFQGFLFKRHQLCIPRHSIRVSLIREVHEGGLACHHGIDKTTNLLQTHFFWPTDARCGTHHSPLSMETEDPAIITKSLVNDYDNFIAKLSSDEPNSDALYAQHQSPKLAPFANIVQSKSNKRVVKISELRNSDKVDLILI